MIFFKIFVSNLREQIFVSFRILFQLIITVFRENMSTPCSSAPVGCTLVVSPADNVAESASLAII